MSGMPQRRSPAPAAPSQTLTTTEPSLGPQTGESTRTPPARILRLRGARASADRSVQWAEGVVDNEGLGRKSSKVCCIYHKPKAVDESSDESSSSSDSDASSGAGSDYDADRKGKARACGHDHGRRGRKKDHKKGDDGESRRRRPSPNAYEKVPKPKPKEASHKAEGSKGHTSDAANV